LIKKAYDEEEESSEDSAGCGTLGAVFSHSRMSSVRPPRPIEVKKLMENLRVVRGRQKGAAMYLVFFGLSFGMMPWKYCCSVGSRSRAFSLAIPVLSKSLSEPLFLVVVAI